MKAWKEIVLAVGLSVSSGAWATDGNDLLNGCQATIRLLDTKQSSPSDSIGIGQCLGMVESAKSTLAVYGEQISKVTRGCIPINSVNIGQAVRVVNKYLHDNPAQLNQDATLLILLAYKDAFPCK